MKTKQAKFSSVPVGGFFYMFELGEWLFKVSRRRGVVGAYGGNHVYAPNASTVVLVLE